MDCVGEHVDDLIDRLNSLLLDNYAVGRWGYCGEEQNGKSVSNCLKWSASSLFNQGEIFGA
jgi:hypothetical protein